LSLAADLGYSSGKYLPLVGRFGRGILGYLEMPTTETNIAVKTNVDAGNQSAGGVRSQDAGAGVAFKDAFDGASLAGIRGYVDEKVQVDGPRMAGIRGFSEESDRVDGPRMAGIRGFSQPNAAPGGATFADTAGMLRLRGDGGNTEPTLQFRNSGMKAYQDMLGMPALAVG